MIITRHGPLPHGAGKTSRHGLQNRLEEDRDRRIRQVDAGTPAEVTLRVLVLNVEAPIRENRARRVFANEAQEAMTPVLNELRILASKYDDLPQPAGAGGDDCRS